MIEQLPKGKNLKDFLEEYTRASQLSDRELNLNPASQAETQLKLPMVFVHLSPI